MATAVCSVASMAALLGSGHPPNVRRLSDGRITVSTAVASRSSSVAGVLRSGGAALNRRRASRHDHQAK
jgi:hypothetical protein